MRSEQNCDNTAVVVWSIAFMIIVILIIMENGIKSALLQNANIINSDQSSCMIL